MAIKDITLALSDTEDSTLTLTSSNAVAIAIRNILLSQEGNFVNIPWIKFRYFSIVIRSNRRRWYFQT